jgi:hypothetical protein
VVGPVDAGFEGTPVKTLVFVALTILACVALALVLGAVHRYWGEQVAIFIDQLTIAGILAYGIVRWFFA